MAEKNISDDFDEIKFEKVCNLFANEFPNLKFYPSEHSYSELEESFGNYSSIYIEDGSYCHKKEYSVTALLHIEFNEEKMITPRYLLKLMNDHNFGNISEDHTDYAGFHNYEDNKFRITLNS
jgi:hypothetical protein